MATEKAYTTKSSQSEHRGVASLKQRLRHVAVIVFRVHEECGSHWEYGDHSGESPDHLVDFPTLASERQLHLGALESSGLQGRQE